MLAKIKYLGLATAGPSSIPLWGNDVITPAGTYYSVAVIDDKKNVVQSAMYQFTGSGTIDISTVTPLHPPPLTPRPTHTGERDLHHRAHLNNPRFPLQHSPGSDLRLYVDSKRNQLNHDRLQPRPGDHLYSAHRHARALYFRMGRQCKERTSRKHGSRKRKHLCIHGGPAR